MPALPAHSALHQVAQQRPAHTAPSHTSSSGKKKTHKMPRQVVHSHGYTYIVFDNRLLHTAEVSQAIKSAKTPRAVIGALRKAYLRKGYFLTAIVGRARGKLVLVRVVHGRLTHVKGPRQLTWFFDGLKGNDRVRNSDVIRRATLAQAFDATNGQTPQVRFKPAPEVGGSTMVVSQHKLAHHQPVGGALTFGNFGNRYAGHYLAQARVYAQGHGLTFSVNQSRALAGLSQNTHGAYYNATGVKLSDVTPWGIYALDYNYTKYQLGDAFAPLYPVGKILTYGMTGEQLLFADVRTRLLLKEGVHYVGDKETVFHGFYTLRNQRYDVWHLGLQFNHRMGGLLGRAASVSAGADVKIGTGTGGASGFATPGNGNPNPHFDLYSANLGLTQSLPGAYTLALNLSGQTTPDTLPEYEQWVLGGLNNLTAYLPGTVAGDRGYLARLTLQSPTWRLGALQLTPQVFVEHGAARYSFVPKNSAVWHGLSDAGASLSLSVPDTRTRATVAYAYPLGSLHVAHKVRQGQQAHLFFYLSQAF